MPPKRKAASVVAKKAAAATASPAVGGGRTRASSKRGRTEVAPAGVSAVATVALSSKRRKPTPTTTTTNPTTSTTSTTTTTTPKPDITPAAPKPAAAPDGAVPEIDVVISFDTTGSMSSCINEVRKHIKELVGRLFAELTQLRIGIVAHGDYCDTHTTYLMKQLDLTDQPDEIVKFVTQTGNTGGGDYPEAYEYVLREVRKLSWRPAAMRALVMIGDAYPHNVSDNPGKIDWRVECDELKTMNVAIYGVQALNSGHGMSQTFYRTMAEITNGYHLYLDQFSYVRDMILAVCIRQCGEERLTVYEQELIARPSGLTQSMRRMFDTMLGRKSTLPAVSDVNYGSSATVSDDTASVADLRPCPPSKYQVLSVPNDVSIKEFVQSEGLTFKTGKGFYEFTKPEQISWKKEIVLMKKSTGELFEGLAARSIAGITRANEKKKVAPGEGALGDYRVFVQSTSYNRKLVADSGFLYEAEDYGRM